MSKLFLNGEEAIQFDGGQTTIGEVAGAAILDFPTDYISGYQMTWVDGDTIDVTGGFARDDTDIFNIRIDGTTQIKLSTHLDTVIEIADTWYSICVVGDTEGNNSPIFIFSDSPNPSLPSGYDVSRRIGWVKNDSSSDILSFEEVGNGINRTIWWTQENTYTRILTNGLDLTFTEIDASGYVPPTSNEFICLISFKTGSGGGSQSDNKLHIRGKSSNISNSLSVYSTGEKTTDFMNDHLLIRIDDNQLFEYRCDASANRATLAVAAFKDVL